QGQGFGAVQGEVTLDGTPLPITAWSDATIDVDIPATTLAGAYQMEIAAANGNQSVNGLTMHVLGTGYNPTVYEVGPAYTYPTIQAGINAASGANGDALVVVYPDTPVQWNPTGVYYENLVMYAPIKLQGIGPGGLYQDGTPVLGTAVDGRGVAGDTGYADIWRTLVSSLTWDGNQAMYEGPVVYILAEDGEFTNVFNAAIDGFTIQGGDQQGFPNNLTPADPTQQEFAAVQGGGIFANAYARYLQITNNVMQSNGGAYAGAIRLGTPHLPGAFNDNQNDFVRIANNRILANGGTNLAGGIGIFSGSEGYEVTNNDICGNFSAEYGGGISHYGLSPNGLIDGNRIYFNRSYDEGGGIMIAGELQADPAMLSPGAGPVDISNNLIQANLGNDDGGGIRFLMAGNYPFEVFNNIIVNNISTHEGGGVSLNDAPDVRFYNNTVMKNITTATAVTSTGQPAPAGLSSSRNSDILQATLPGGSPIFSDPLLFNNVFWDNRAGAYTGGTVAGIGLADDLLNPVYNWDLGVSDGSGLLSPTNTVLQTTTGTITDGSNVSADPTVASLYDTSVLVLPWRGNPRFVDITMVTVDATPNLLGDYHLQAGSPAIDVGATDKAGTNAPGTDIDGDIRPAAGGFDIGADEVGSGTPPTPTVELYFSTINSVAVPDVAAPHDDADIYSWDGTTYDRIFDGNVDGGLPGNADIDALHVVDEDTFYISFRRNGGTTVPTLGIVDDEDVVLYDAGAWSLYFDGSDVGLGNVNAQDVDAFQLMPDGSVLISLVGNNQFTGIGGIQRDEDLIQCVGSFGPTTFCSWNLYFDGGDVDLNAGAEDVDGTALAADGNIYLTTQGNYSITQLLSGNNSDVFVCDTPTTGSNTTCSSFTKFFDSTANGMTDNLDAIALP
ncbi:MAG: hypothetical protein GY942_01000, partial [Aestuariibacter sp.]|nr:hypothetical protein [Aestuariibacter sp.]